MSFDENNQEQESGDHKDKRKTFFGLELSNGVIYTVVIILTIIFIRQVAVVIQALN